MNEILQLKNQTVYK